MPILEINILGSKVKIEHQENERKKLINLIDQFKSRLSEFENLQGRFSDNKIIFLAALKAEDYIQGLKNKLDSGKNKKISSFADNEKIEIKNKEIVRLKDQIYFLKKENQKLSNQNKITFDKFKEVNKMLILLINKIINANKNEY